MHTEAIRKYCIQKKGVQEGFPFGSEVLVFKVMGKIFALLPLDNADSINLKCDPAKAIELREEWEEVQPGFHMNKKHWNTVTLNGRLPDSLLRTMIDDSYNLVKSSLTRDQKAKLENL